MQKTYTSPLSGLYWQRRLHVSESTDYSPHKIIRLTQNVGKMGNRNVLDVVISP